MKKFFAATLCLGLLLAAGCTGGKEDGSKAASGAGEDAYFTYGVETLYPPMEFIGDDGNATGFDIELADALAKKMGKTAKLTSVDWAGLFTGLESKKYDAVISATSWNQERADKYLLTDPYIENKVVLIVKPDATYKSPADLAGKTVGFLSQSTAEDVAKEQHETAKFGKLSDYDNMTQPFADLKVGGRIDAVFSDLVVANYYTSTEKDHFKTVWTSSEPEPFVICLRKDSGALQAKLNQAIKDLKADGTIKALSEKWFNSDITAK